MRRHRSIFDTFPENVDLNQGPNYNSRGINESDECNNRLSPTERRLLSNDLSSEINFSRVNANANDHHNAQRFSNWDVGESSSRANLQDQSFGGSQVAVGSLRMHRSDSNHMPMDVDLNLDYGGNSGNDNGHGFGFMNLNKSGSPEMEASSSGTSDESGTDLSFGNWGLSCNRKTLEGTSGEIFGSGSSSRFPEAENIAWNTHPNRNNAPMVNSREPINTVTGVTFSPPSVPESSWRSYRDSGSFNISSNGNPGSSSRRHSHSENLDETPRGTIWSSANSNHSSNVQQPLIQAPGMPRHLRPFPWSGSSSSPLSREINSEANFRSSLRNNEQNRYFVSSNETRNLVQDPNNLSLGTGRASSNGGNSSSSSRNEMGSRSNSSNGIWTPRLNPTTQSQPRSSDFTPWTLFPSSEADSGGHRGQFSFFPLGSSSTSDENVLPTGINSQGRNHQPSSRSSSSMEVPGDEWQAFAADIEGRHRLVSEMRQILNALRRGENLRAEDYVLFDPFINGVAELHDRHRDMRLDVDNMSYEELLALEERIGDVKTGLSEEVILKSMRQRKHTSFMAMLPQNSEPCCICREEYDNGDDIGTLDCGHDFHTCCVKEWLSQKNLCPICKMTGLST